MSKEFEKRFTIHIFKRENIPIILSWTAVLLWLVLIFYLSSQPAVESNGLSKKVTEFIVEKVGYIIPLDSETSTTSDLVARFNHIVRKFAHFGIYFILGLLVINAFRASNIKGSKGFVFSMVFCILYAISDEIHQLFVPGRGAQVIDVLIDSLGASVGNGIYGVVNILER